MGPTKALEGINGTFTLLGDEFRDLNERALGDYSRYLSDYQDLLGRGAGTVNSDGLQAADVAEKLVFYSAQSFEYAKGALAAQDSLLKVIANEVPQSQNLSDLCKAAVNSNIEEIFRINDRYSTLAAEANNAREAAKAKSTQSVVWEDAAMTFEDCAYNFSEHQEGLLAAALAFNQEHVQGQAGQGPRGGEQLSQALSLRLAWALAGVNREKYLPLLAQYGQEAWLKSDESFRVSPTFEGGWESPEFQDTGWTSPNVVPQESPAAELAGAKALWTVPTAITPPPDTSNQQPAISYQFSDSVYVRKVFDIGQEPVAGDLWIKAAGGFALQVNGELVAAVDPSQANGQILHYDVAPLLKNGRNIITILAVDPNAEKNGLTLALKYKELPSPTYVEP
jgi:hypothetical protein